MSILLFIVGAITLVIGSLAIGYGATINEFSFGNTLIVAGTTAAVGGLIVVGLGAVVSHLQHLVETVATRAPLRPNRPPETAEAARAPVAGRAPFPPRAKDEAEIGEAPPVEPVLPGLAPAVVAAGEPLAEAPTLPNPDVAPEAALREEFEEAPPPPPSFVAPPPVAELGEPAAAAPPPGANGAQEPEPEPEPLPAWLSTPRAAEPPSPEPLQPPLEPANFEAVWPPLRGHAGDQPKVGEMAEETQPAAASPVQEATEEAAAAERRSVAILKSGVVDGMGYTLYVDGSIEAELPQGTLRFASINELREHLERAS
jgi:hypothetical protein